MGDLGINAGEGVSAAEQGRGEPTPPTGTPPPGMSAPTPAPTASPAQDLNVGVVEHVRAAEAFGPGGRTQEQLKMTQQGIAGTFQVTNPETLHAMADSAWDLSVKTQKPVVVVVRAPRQAGT